MKTTTLLTSRAKAISWVTTIMVMPWCASSSITDRTSPVTSGSSALVGSSNFTYPGLTENIELNVQIGGTPVAVLQEWYEQHWNDAEDVTPQILRVIERHIREYTPFEVYAKSLQEFFRGHEMTAGEWETAGAEDGGSHVYPLLDLYQKQGYQALMKIAQTYDGAFLCDGVGLGKTFVGLMLIERLVLKEGKNVVVFVPKAANEPVWRPAIKKYLPHIGTAFTNLRLFNHTDLQRAGDYAELMADIRSRADVVVIDEAHHFRKGAGDFWARCTPGGPESGKKSKSGKFLANSGGGGGGFRLLPSTECGVAW